MPDATTIALGLIVLAALSGPITRRLRGTTGSAPNLDAFCSTPLPDDAGSYVSTVRAGLDLPDDIRDEIEIELRDHIEDSIAALEAEGLDRNRAAREALARLGRAEELARQLRRAHQSRRRLLAGAAGGVFSAANGIVFGYLLGAVIVMIVTIVGAIALALTVGRYIPAIPPSQLASGTIFAASIACVPAFLAARRAVSTSAEISRRPARQLAVWWALFGAVPIATLVLFVVPAQQSWFAVAAELAVPIAFAAGALVRPRVRVPAPGWRAATAAIIVAIVVPVALMSVATSQSGTSLTPIGVQIDPSHPDPNLHMEHIGRIAPGLSAPLQSDSWYPGKPGLHVTIDSGSLSGWRDVRIEAWRATGYPGKPDYPLATVDTRFSTPLATWQVHDPSQGVTIRPTDVRSRSTRWLLVATAVGSDGERYLLTPWAHDFEVDFSGTVWDWLTASD